MLCPFDSSFRALKGVKHRVSYFWTWISPDRECLPQSITKGFHMDQIREELAEMLQHLRAIQTCLENQDFVPENPERLLSTMEHATDELSHVRIMVDGDFKAMCDAAAAKDEEGVAKD